MKLAQALLGCVERCHLARGYVGSESLHLVFGHDKAADVDPLSASARVGRLERAAHGLVASCSVEVAQAVDYRVAHKLVDGHAVVPQALAQGRGGHGEALV